MTAPSALAELLAGSPDQVAPRLLGARLRHGDVVVRLTEVEAYGGADDPGSHAYRGRTRRNQTMFGPAGRLYCYFTYGMHVCANVVTGPVDEPGAVLIRAGQVVSGVDLARRRRPRTPDAALARGPAVLCRALDIDLGLDGAHLEAGPVLLEAAGRPAGPISTGPRVGLRGAPDRPWRFWVSGDPTVTRYRPAAPPRAR